MPQVAIQNRSHSSPAPMLEVSRPGQITGELFVNGCNTAIRCRSSGVTGFMARIFARTSARRPAPEQSNPHIAALPAPALESIFAYLGDPFERVTFAMTCRILMQRLGRYRIEFALFRQLIADKKAIDFRVQSGLKREITYFLHDITSAHWTSWRAANVLRNAFAKLDALYPHVPERAFHELWPLFKKLKPETATRLLEELVGKAMARSPHWAVIILGELARRTVQNLIGPDFQDKLLELTIPLWQHPDTAQEADAVIGAIAQHCVDVEQPKTHDDARWKKIFALLPPSARPDSRSVIGLANAGLAIQYKWEKHGKQSGLYFPALDLLRARLGRLPSYNVIRAHDLPFWIPEEIPIENRRHQRYLASPLYAEDRARDEADDEAMAWGHTGISCQTAGGGG